jgi:zinc transporter ZupT
MEFWEYLILILSVLIGGGIAFYVKHYNQTVLQMLLSFVGAYIMGITVMHLLPSVYQEHNHYIGLWILGGFFIQIVLELLSGGVEHGHVHPSQEPKFGFALQILLGLCVHAFIEGMPLETYDAFQLDIHGSEHGHKHQHLLYGIILHKAPAAFVLVFLLSVSRFKKSFIITALVIFSLMSPLGAWSAGALIEHGILNPSTTRVFLAIVIGSFLHIATTILFETESSGHHHISIKKVLMIVFGLGLAILTILS